MGQDTILTLETVVMRRPGVISAPVGRETATMSVDRGMYYGLDDIGTCIWGLLAAPYTVSGICEQLMEIYAVDTDNCRRDVITFLSNLLGAGMIEIVRG